jgi:hypothetical protein
MVVVQDWLHLVVELLLRTPQSIRRNFKLHNSDCDLVGNPSKILHAT